MGGEKVMCNSRDGARLGSPPRGRGKAYRHSAARALPRITPAWAGKRRRGELHEQVQRDHPRVGGEKAAIKVDRFADVGITPAWAGKSGLACVKIGLNQDHPRVGGEKVTLVRRSMAV